jgi:hypothetical protein
MHATLGGTSMLASTLRELSVGLSWGPFQMYRARVGLRAGVAGRMCTTAWCTSVEAHALHMAIPANTIAHHPNYFHIH